MTSILASNNIQYSSDAEDSVLSGSYIKIKEININEVFNGSWRIVFDMKAQNGSYFAYGKIYKNGAAYGSAQSSSSIGYITYSQDFTGITINNGDKIQIYGYSTPAWLCYIQNFRIEFNYIPVLTVQDTTDEFSLPEHNSWGVQAGLPLPKALRPMRII